MNSLIVGGLLRRVYDSFDMSTFENRLKLQKIIYLIQAEGINLGYSFKLYLYGPYCLELTKTGYYLEDFENIQPIKIEDAILEEKFQKFLEKIKPFKNDANWLEIASILHLFKYFNPHETDENLIKKVQKIKNYSADEILETLQNIKGWLICQN